MFSKVLNNYKRYGLINIIKYLIKKKFNINININDSIQNKRLYLFKEIEKITNCEVASGLYKKTKFIKSSNYFLAKSAQLLGFYEKEIQEKIFELKNKKNLNYFINLGAGEGFHAVGSMTKKIFKKCITFEMNKENKISIKDNFRINNINSYEIFDIADVYFLNKIKDKIELNKSLFLFDIEGEEFSVLTEKNLEILKNSYLIIEFHDFYSDKETVANFIQRLKNIYKLEYVKTGNRNFSGLSILDKFNDDEKWLMMSESRPSTMRWIICEPKS